MGRISVLAVVIKLLHERWPNEELVLFKTDFKSAYRCLPIRSSHRALANVILWHEDLGKLVMSTQFAMPFGSVAAVYAWDRLADALVHVLTSALRVPIIRYVDDLFGVCFAYEAARLREYIIELVTMCGFAVEPEKTPLPASIQTVLGVNLELVRSARRGKQRLQLRARLDEDRQSIGKLW